MKSRILFLTVILGLSFSGCARYRPGLDSYAAYLQRVQTQEQGDLSVSVVGLGAQESKKVFGVDLAKSRILPLWVKIENRDPAKSFFFLERGLTAEYYPAGEAAYIARIKPGIRLFDRPFLRLLLPLGFAAMPVDHFFVRSANEKMRQTFNAQAIQYGWILPGTTKSGFVFLPQELGTKHVTIDLYGEEIKTGGAGQRHFSFFVHIPGINPDYRSKTFESYYAADKVSNMTDEKELQKALEALPRFVTDMSGRRNADPVNLIAIGTLDDLLAAFTTAQWDETEVTSFKSAMKMAKSFVFGKEYNYSPFSPLFLYGRSQDIGIQKARNIHERMHLRLWYSPMRYQGKPVWVGQVSRDIGVRFTLKTWNLMTHKIDPDIDESALYVLSDLLYKKSVEKYGIVAGGIPSTPEKPAKNLTGDPYFTSGKRIVILLPDREQAASEFSGRLFVGQ